MEITVRPAKMSDSKGIVNLHCSEVSAWYRDPVTKTGRTTYARLTPVQRFLHGGYWMDEGFCRRHLRRYSEWGNRVYVAETRGGPTGPRTVGEIEVWFDREPSPFHEYAEIEMIMIDRSSAPGQVERQMIEHIQQEMRALGHVNLDISPGHSGGSPELLKEFGFQTLWDTRCFTGVPDRIEECDEAVRLGKLGPGNRSLGRRTLQFCHYEPFWFAWENRFRDWYLPNAAHRSFFEPLFQKRVRLLKMRRDFSLLVERLSFFHDEVRAFVWARTDGEHLKGDGEFVRKAATATAGIVRGLGIRKFLFYAPWFCEDELRSAGFRDGTKQDLWLRKDLS